jgi:hypothetical protein
MKHLKKLGLAMAMPDGGGQRRWIGMGDDDRPGQHGVHDDVDEHGAGAQRWWVGYLFDLDDQRHDARLGGTTWVGVDETMAFSGCSAFGFSASVTPIAACNTTAKFRGHFSSLTIGHWLHLLTISTGCSIDVGIPVLGCTLTVTGGQTVGNGTAGTGGAAGTNGSPKSSLVFNAATINTIDSNGVGAGCATAGSHTGTLSGTYNVSSATNVTVTP